MPSASSHPPAPLDSNRLLELEDKLRSGANWLIYLSVLTIFCGLALGFLLAFEGIVYLALAVVVRVKQSSLAALALFLAACAAGVSALLALRGHGQSWAYVGFAMPALALGVSAFTVVTAFRLHRMLSPPPPEGPGQGHVGGA